MEEKNVQDLGKMRGSHHDLSNFFHLVLEFIHTSLCISEFSFSE